MIRKIKVISTLGVSGTIETNVTTSAELKPLLQQKNIDYSGMKLVVGETRNEITLDEAVLPTGDFKLYLMPMKTKSGGTDRISRLMYKLAETFEELGEEFNSLDLNSNSGVDTDKSDISVEDAQDMEDLRELMG